MPAPESERPAPQDSRAVFATTHWSVVLSAGGTTTPSAQPALAQLCQSYWFPLYAWLRRHGHNSHDAQDLVQEFLMHLVAHKGLAGVGPAKGRFRSYLITCLRHFVADCKRQAIALKRGGGMTFTSLDAGEADHLYELDAGRSATPDALYERRWAIALLERAMDALRIEQDSAGKGELYAALRPFLTDYAGSGEYDEVAPRLAMTTNAIGVAVNRLRTRLRQLVRQEILITVDSPADVDDELKHLQAVMRG